MAWGFLAIGILAIIVAWKNNYPELFALLKDDFTGSGNFPYWLGAIVFLVVLGNIKKITPVTDAFLGLVILVIILAQYKGGKNLLQSFISQVKQGMS